MLICRPIRRGRPVFSKVPHTSSYKTPNTALCIPFEELSRVAQDFFEKNQPSKADSEPFKALSNSSGLTDAKCAEPSCMLCNMGYATKPATMGWGDSPLKASTVKDILAKFDEATKQLTSIQGVPSGVPFGPFSFQPSPIPGLGDLLKSYQSSISSSLGMSMKVLKSNTYTEPKFQLPINSLFMFLKKGDVGGDE